jgi:hypothetical protein
MYSCNLFLFWLFFFFLLKPKIFLSHTLSEVEDSTDLEACNVVFFGSNEKFTFNTPQTNEYTHADRNTYFYVSSH